MPASRLFVLFALSFTLLPASGSAQEVEFDIPTEIDIVQGRLSVTFQDGISEETARLLVTGLGYGIIETAFEPRLVWTTLQSRLSARQMRQLRNDPRVIDVQQTAIPQPVETIADDEREQPNPQFSLAITFIPTVSQEEAAELLDTSIGATLSRSEKRPNELVIEVGDQDAEAFTALEGLDEVKWVTYVGVAGE
jgi:hypothetical protein